MDALHRAAQVQPSVFGRDLRRLMSEKDLRRLMSEKDLRRLMSEKGRDTGKACYWSTHTAGLQPLQHQP
jgi:hypothetical protein